MDHEIPSVTEITMAEIERRCALEENEAAKDRERVEALSFYLSEFLRKTDQIGTVFVLWNWSDELGFEALDCMMNDWTWSRVVDRWAAYGWTLARSRTRKMVWITTGRLVRYTKHRSSDPANPKLWNRTGQS